MCICILKAYSLGNVDFFFQLPDFIEETKTPKKKTNFLRVPNLFISESTTNLQIPGSHYNACIYENFCFYHGCLTSPAMASHLHTSFGEYLPSPSLGPNRLSGFYFQLQLLLFCLARESQLTT